MSEGGVSQAPDLIHQNPKTPDIAGSGVLAIEDGLYGEGRGTGNEASLGQGIK